MREACTKYEAMMTMERAWCRLNQVIKGNVLDEHKEAVHKLMRTISLKTYLDNRLRKYYTNNGLCYGILDFITTNGHYTKHENPLTIKEVEDAVRRIEYVQLARMSPPVLSQFIQPHYTFLGNS